MGNDDFFLFFKKKCFFLVFGCCLSSTVRPFQSFTTATDTDNLLFVVQLFIYACFEVLLPPAGIALYMLPTCHEGPWAHASTN